MFAALRNRLVVPITIKPFIKFDTYGDKVFGDNIDIKCYPENKLRTVVNAEGTQVMSSAALYLDGSVVVSKLDNVIWNGDERPVQGMDEFYDKHGNLDIVVVYL